MIDILIPSCKNISEIEKQIREIEANTPEKHKITCSCIKQSAAKNRNWVHSQAQSKVVVMMDDDMTGFYPGWLSALIKPLVSLDIVFSSARLINSNGSFAPMMHTKFIVDVEYEYPPACPTACFAYVKNNLDSLVNFHNKTSLPFDEEFIGGGWEDTALCADLKVRFPNSKFVISNDCKLIHLNEMKNQHINDTYRKNKQYYASSGRKRI